MKNIKRIISILGIGFLLSGCFSNPETGGKTSGGKTSGEETEKPDYSMYEWDKLDIKDSYKKKLYSFEKAEPFTYTKDEKIYVKCSNGDYIYGKSGSFQVFSRTNSYAHFECGSSSYSYYDCGGKKDEFYNELANFFGYSIDLKEAIKGDSKATYKEAVSMLNTEVYSYYRVNKQLFKNGLFCNRYVAYGSNFKNDFIITRYADVDDRTYNTFYEGLNPIKNRITKYIVHRSESRNILTDNNNEITFGNVGVLEAKTLHDKMIKCGVEIVKDTFTEGSTDFTTKIKLHVGAITKTTLGASLYKTAMTINYSGEKITYTYAYQDPIATGNNINMLTYLGDCYVKGLGNNTYEYELKQYSEDLIPVLPQTDQNYITYNTVE